MSFRVPSHLYRNRHGTFYFRHCIPKALRATAGMTELRFSLETQDRRVAIIRALTLIADLPRLADCLQCMADNNETPPQDFFKLWKLQMVSNAKLKMENVILKEELQGYRDQLAATVPREQAKNVAKQAHALGKFNGQSGAIERLEFPWAPERTKCFSELSAAYLNHFTYRAKGGARKPPGEKTLAGYENDIAFFISVMGDVHIGSIDRDMAGEYFNILRRLPANISRKAEYRGKTIPELLEINAPPQSEYNASKKMERPSGMFRWALLEKRKWGIDANPFEGYGQSGDNATKRRPFTKVELQMLLQHPDYVKRRFATAYSFWLIPLAIFTGARLGELAQLDIKDFVEIEGIDCIDINDLDAALNVEVDGRKKRVKTKNSKRLVPIHPELVRQGLLRYVAGLRDRGQTQLFPELSRKRRDGPAQAASNWFQRFRQRVGITTKQETVFHSFRHGFITNLLDAGVTPYLVAPIVGHEAELITGQIYWDVKDASKRKPTVDAFALPAEVLGLFPLVEDITFVQPPGRRVVQAVGRRLSK